MNILIDINEPLSLFNKLLIRRKNINLINAYKALHSANKTDPSTCGVEPAICVTRNNGVNLVVNQATLG